MEKMLLLEQFESILELDLKESNGDRGLLKFKGKLQEAEAVNKNKRSYPFSVLDENVQRLMDVCKARGLLGELDHPNDSIVHFKEASHVITKLWWEGNILMGEGEVLNTAHGRQLKALLNDGIRVGMSSRGVGNGKMNENGVLVISDSYRLITFDAVNDPSCYDAFQEKVLGVKKENYSTFTNKNTNTRIDNYNVEQMTAAIRSIFKQTTNQIKEGLK